MAKKYKCPYCQYSNLREDLIEHIEDTHQEMIPEGYSARRIVFNKINKREHGVCMACKGKTEWNEKAGRYASLCGKPACTKEVRAVYEERMLRVHHTTCMLNNPDHQTKMLAKRTISGEYKFANGDKVTYTGSYEKKLLEFEEKVLGIESKDIIMPGPKLEYKFNGETHTWITDQLLIPWNLIIEVKDGGNNPNTRPMDSYRDKQVSKEIMITDLGTFNYIRLTNNQFDQLLGILAELKADMLDNSDENRNMIIRIHEAANAATNAIPPISSCYVLAYGYRKNVFSDEIEGFALSPDVISNEIYTIQNGKIVRESMKFLDDRKFSIYKYVGTKSINEILTTENVGDNYFYATLAESGLITKDLLDFSSMFNTISVETINDLNAAISSTILHQFREAAGEDEMYFPIRHPNIEYTKKAVLDSNTNIDILKDVEGYFVLNKNLNQRSKSYPTVGEIPKTVADTLATKSIKEVIDYV